MQGKTHLVVGAAAGLAVGIYARPDDWLTVALAAGCGGAYALVPDWLQINIPGVKQIKGMFGHRGFSHWVWLPLLLFALAWRLDPVLAGASLAGWLSHILLDSLSSGVPAFWPFGRLTLAKVKTGGRTDSLIGGAALIVLAGLGVLWIENL